MPHVARIEDDPKYDLVHKVGSITLDHGVRGPELDRELRTATEDFMRAMEMRGLILYRPPGGRLITQQGMMTNPAWIENPDGEAAAFYAIDWEGKRPRTEVRADGREHVLPTPRERSLEDSRGEVEYRIVGIFWAPRRAVEMLVSRSERLEQERRARNPKVFGPAGAPLPAL